MVLEAGKLVAVALRTWGFSLTLALALSRARACVARALSRSVACSLSLVLSSSLSLSLLRALSFSLSRFPSLSISPFLPLSLVVSLALSLSRSRSLALSLLPYPFVGSSEGKVVYCVPCHPALQTLPYIATTNAYIHIRAGIAGVRTSLSARGINAHREPGYPACVCAA